MFKLTWESIKSSRKSLNAKVFFFFFQTAYRRRSRLVRVKPQSNQLLIKIPFRFSDDWRKTHAIREKARRRWILIGLSIYWWRSFVYKKSRWWCSGPQRYLPACLPACLHDRLLVSTSTTIDAWKGENSWGDDLRGKLIFLKCDGETQNQKETVN